MTLKTLKPVIVSVLIAALLVVNGLLGEAKFRELRAHGVRLEAEVTAISRSENDDFHDTSSKMRSQTTWGVIWKASHEGRVIEVHKRLTFLGGREVGHKEPITVVPNRPEIWILGHDVPPEGSPNVLWGIAAAVIAIGCVVAAVNTRGSRMG